MNIVDKITPEHIRKLVPYSSAKRELFGYQIANQSLWLNANESPYAGGLSEHLDENINRYPNFQSDSLIELYAEYADVDLSSILVTRGADEGIELLIKTFCLAGKDKIIINPPTYGMYKICADTSNIETIEVPLSDKYQIDTEKLIAAKDDNVKLVFICSPNNPTGGLTGRPKILEVLEAYKDSALVVVDEAYIEFCPVSAVEDLIHSYPNLVVLRTLSKAFGLAGIRCGFTLASSDVIDMMKKVIAPYPIPAPIEQIALEAISEAGVEQMRQHVSLLNLEKQQFISNLQRLNLVKNILHSDTNFVLIEVDDKQQVLDALTAQDIYIRDQSKQPGLANHIRITVGNEQQMQAVIAVLEGLDSWHNKQYYLSTETAP